MGAPAHERLRSAAAALPALLAVLLAAALVGLRLAGLRPYVILSGSMEPVYPVGSLVYVRPAAAGSVAAGDAIAFYLADGETVAVHRVIGVDEARACFSTKGDANDAPDAAPVAFTSLIGKPALCVPYLGYAAAWLAQPPGLYIGAAAVAGMLLLLLLPGRGASASRAETDSAAGRRRTTRRARAEAVRALREAEAVRNRTGRAR